MLITVPSLSAHMTKSNTDSEPDIVRIGSDPVCLEGRDPECTGSSDTAALSSHHESH